MNIMCMFLNCQVVPEDVWDCGLSVRVLDLSCNFIEELSAKICSLKHLNVTFLSFVFITAYLIILVLFLNSRREISFILVKNVRNQMLYHVFNVCTL